MAIKILVFETLCSLFLACACVCTHDKIMGDLYEPLERQAMLARLKVKYQNKADSPSAWWNRNSAKTIGASYAVNPPPLTGPSSAPSKTYLRSAQAVDDPTELF